IEHRLQIYLDSIGEEAAARGGMGAMLKRLLAIRPQHSYILNKVDQLRVFRNPFSHLKPFDHPHTISQVSLTKRMHPNEVLFRNARDSLAVMYTVAVTDWK